MGLLPRGQQWSSALRSNKGYWLPLDWGTNVCAMLVLVCFVERRGQLLYARLTLRVLGSQRLDFFLRGPLLNIRDPLLLVSFARKHL